MRTEATEPFMADTDSIIEHYPDVKLIDPQQRFSEFNYTFPPPSFPVLQKDFKNPPNCGEKSYEGRGRLQGLKALITGGDSGIGRAIAIAYAREGAKVTINYLPAEEPDAELLAQFLEREGILIDRIPGDLRDEAFCAKLIKQAVVSMGGLDILINNAGYVRARLIGSSRLQLTILTFICIVTQHRLTLKVQSRPTTTQLPNSCRPSKPTSLLGSTSLGLRCLGCLEVEASYLRRPSSSLSPCLGVSTTARAKVP
jgi:hypothetical protein